MTFFIVEKIVRIVRGEDHGHGHSHSHPRKAKHSDSENENDGDKGKEVLKKNRLKEKVF